MYVVLPVDNIATKFKDAFRVRASRGRVNNDLNLGHHFVFKMARPVTLLMGNLSLLSFLQFSFFDFRMTGMGLTDRRTHWE